eukprot:g14998.t1
MLRVPLPPAFQFSISFNDGELESTFEYPSELALLSELGLEREDSEEAVTAVKPRARDPAEDEDEEEVEEGSLARRLGVDKTSSVGTALHRRRLLV